MNKKKMNGLLLTVTSAMLIVACGGTRSKANYFTYNTYLETKPKTWNVHNWETNDEAYIGSFTEMGFYDTQLNATKDGYEIVCEMAADFPVDVTGDVTDDEMDKYGYGGNIDKGFVWDISLNEKACWEDGTPITADDYIESMKRQLRADMVNFRADSYYSSSMVIANAEKYFKQGRSTIEALFPFIGADGNFTNKTVCEDGKYYFNISRATPYAASVFSGTDGTEGFYTVLNNRSSSAGDDVELAAQRITDAARYYIWKYGPHDADHKSDWEEILDANIYEDGDTEKKNPVWNAKLTNIKEEMMNVDIYIDEFDDKEVLVRTTKDDSTKDHTEVYSSKKLKNDITKVVGALGNSYRGKEWAWKLPLFGTVYNDYTQAWDSEESGVGLVKVDKYTLRLYLAQSMTELDLKFSLASNWLVKVDLYDSLIVETSAGLVSTKYATPDEGVKGYMSYGPYKLTKMEAGKSFLIEKNDKWYGYNDGKHVNQYQMDAVYTRIITDHNTALQEFEAGRLDDFALNRNDMKTYGNSSRLTRTYESYTQKISMNSNRKKLLSRQTGNGNKTILANDDFRKGLSLSMDRNNFASQTTAGSKAFTSLLNDLYLTEVEEGEMYRNTKQGKGVYDAVYGKLGGNPYDPNYVETPLAENAQGFNFNMATWYVAKGIKAELESKEDGHLVANNVIDLEFRVYDNESETTIDMLTFITKSFSDVVAAAVEKLKADGTLKSNENITITINSQKDEDYYNTAKNGGYDLIFSTWGGAAINPIGLMQVYCDSTFDSCCEYGFKGKQNDTYLEIDANGNGTIEDSENKTFNAWWSEANTIVENDEKGTTEWTEKHNKILNILAGLEAGIINRFEAIPLVARATSSLNSFKIENGTSTYINLIGYGGIRHMTFNYDDAGWDSFCGKYNNKLSDLYKD